MLEISDSDISYRCDPSHPPLIAWLHLRHQRYDSYAILRNPEHEDSTTDPTSGHFMFMVGGIEQGTDTARQHDVPKRPATDDLWVRVNDGTE